MSDASDLATQTRTAVVMKCAVCKHPGAATLHVSRLVPEVGDFPPARWLQPPDGWWLYLDGLGELPQARCPKCLGT